MFLDNVILPNIKCILCMCYIIRFPRKSNQGILKSKELKCKAISFFIFLLSKQLKIKEHCFEKNRKEMLSSFDWKFCEKNFAHASFILNFQLFLKKRKDKKLLIERNLCKMCCLFFEIAFRFDFYFLG